MHSSSNLRNNNVSNNNELSFVQDVSLWPGGGGGYSYIKVTGVLVRKFQEHP